MGQTICSVEGTVLEVNRAHAALMGRTPEELIGTNALEFVHPDDRDAAIELTSKLVRGGQDSFECERRLLHKDGGIIWVSSTTTLERNAVGEPMTYFTLALDITEREGLVDRHEHAAVAG